MNTAISVANLYHLNSSSTESTLLVSDVAENVQDLEERLAIMRLEMEDIRAAQLPAAPPLVDIESAALRTDYKFALRHFLGDTKSEGTITPSPSMQVSSLCGSKSVMLSTLYHTALTHIDGASDLGLERVGFGAEVAQAVESYQRDTTLTIRGAPGPVPLYLQVSADCCLGDLV